MEIDCSKCEQAYDGGVNSVSRQGFMCSLGFEVASDGCGVAGAGLGKQVGHCGEDVGEDWAFEVVGVQCSGNCLKAFGVAVVHHRA